VHGHHRGERPAGGRGIGISDRFGECDRRDLPGEAPAVLAPAAGAFLAAIAHDRVPVAIRFSLVGGGHLKRERLALPEGRPAVEPEAGNPQHGEAHGEHIALLAGGKVARSMQHCPHGRVGEGGGVEVCGFLGAAVVPEADGVFGDGWHGRARGGGGGESWRLAWLWSGVAAGDGGVGAARAG
jgi:hypothetical protein